MFRARHSHQSRAQCRAREFRCKIRFSHDTNSFFAPPADIRARRYAISGYREGTGLARHTPRGRKVAAKIGSFRASTVLHGPPYRPEVTPPVRAGSPRYRTVQENRILSHLPLYRRQWCSRGRDRQRGLRRGTPWAWPPPDFWASGARGAGAAPERAVARQYAYPLFDNCGPGCE